MNPTTTARKPRLLRKTNTNGYLMLRRPSHPMVTRNGYAYAHRVVLFDRIGPGQHKCNWCPRIVTWAHRWPLQPDSLTVDHVDSAKANNDDANLVPSCPSCNSRRAAARRAAIKRLMGRLAA
ncbi:MAG TPA: HNH endonuclease signature motif containing protein [Tepidisphaeraceae bacterium]|jgi:hypothetical protein|nr:HNH endonuclease signature motif containing protein [Tepidisphaeraceae bacterium]